MNNVQHLKIDMFLCYTLKKIILFFQGLMTNDIQHLIAGAPSMYSMLLNSQGRVMHDVIIYNTIEGHKNNYLIEVEKKSAEQLERHLKMYRLRKKIDINIRLDMKSWVVFDPEIDFSSISEVDIECLYMNPKTDFKHQLNISNSIDGMIVSRDPRMTYLGHKIILPVHKDIVDVLPNLTKSDLDCYRNLRYRLGVAEGSDELPQGKVMPLETNVDYLHGISFHKGCYIGQELTARTFHTGVVRKRYMPVVFEEAPSSCIPAETGVLNRDRKTLGRLRALSCKHGVALLKIADALSVDAGLTVESYPVTTFRPAWWPIEPVKPASSSA